MVSEVEASLYDAALNERAVSTAPAPATQVRQAYLSHSTVGFMTYSVGASTAFIAATLALSDAQAGLHSSAVAVAMIVVGTSCEWLDGRFGERRVHVSALALLVLGVLLLGTAIALPFTLVGAAAVGAGNGVLLVFINRTVTTGGGPLARTQLARATLVSMTSALSASLVIGIGVAVGAGWQVFVLPALILIGLGAFVARNRTGRGSSGTRASARLPAAYRVAWLLVMLVVAMEFAIVFWVSAVVQARADVPLEEAAFVPACCWSRLVPSPRGYRHGCW